MCYQPNSFAPGCGKIDIVARRGILTESVSNQLCCGHFSIRCNGEGIGPGREGGGGGVGVGGVGGEG